MNFKKEPFGKRMRRIFGEAFPRFFNWDDRVHPTVKRYGVHVAIHAGMKSQELNDLCKKITKETGQLTDWSFQGGRAYIRTVGDAEKVRALLPYDKGQWG